MKTKYLFSLLILIVLSQTLTAQTEPKVASGIIDLSEWNFEQQGPVRLDGSWSFAWNQFLNHNELTHSAQKDYFDVPALWNDNSSIYEQLQGKGYATYGITILTNPDVPLLSLSLPDFYSSYTVWVNGMQVAANGEVGISRKESEAQWLPLTVVFPAKTDTLTIVLHVSNFQHHKGGVNDHIQLGLPEQLFHTRETAVITNIILFGGLGLIGFFFFILYFFFRNEKAALYFAAICITWAIRSVFTNLYLFIDWFPGMDWELAVKIEYLTLYLTMMWSILFIAQLFPEDTNQTMKRIVLILNAVFIALTLATPAFTYTTLLNAYMVVAWIILAYVAFVVVMAILYKRRGAWFSVASIMLGVIMFSYDMLTHSDVLDFNPLLFSLGYITIFLLNATAFAYQLSKAVPPRSNTTLEWSLP